MLKLIIKIKLWVYAYQYGKELGFLLLQAEIEADAWECFIEQK